MNDAMVERGESGPGERLAYVAFLLFLLFPASGLLQKAGVPAGLLSGAALVLLIGATILPAAFAYAPGFIGFAKPNRRVSMLLSIWQPAAAMLPAGIAIASLSPPGGRGAAIAGAALLLALVLSRFLRRVQGGIPHPAEVTSFLEARGGSRKLAQALCLIVALPPLGILCGQIAAFGYLAELQLGWNAGQGIALCLAIAILQVWISGATGILTGGASLFIAVLATSLLIWIHPDQTVATLPAALQSSPEMAQLALPFLPLAELPEGQAATAALLIAGAAGLAVLPIFSLESHGREQPVRRDAQSLLVTLALLVVLGWLFRTLILAGGEPASGFAMTGQDGSNPGMISRILPLILLAGLAVSAAVPLLSLALLASGQLKPNRRGFLPGRQLALARASIPATALLAGWLCLHFEPWIALATQLAVIVAAAAALPVMLAFLIRPPGAPAAWIAMIAGAVPAGGLYLAHHLEIYRLTYPFSGAALSGMLVALIALGTAFLLQTHKAGKGN